MLTLPSFSKKRNLARNIFFLFVICVLSLILYEFRKKMLADALLNEWLKRQQVNDDIYVYNNIFDSPGVCPEDGRNLFFLVAILSSVHNQAQRMAIRNTWGKEVTRRGGRLVFFLGVSGLLADQVVTRQEWTENEDMVEEGFIDSYENLTIKTLSVLNWVSKRCNRVKFVMKTDDDVFVNAATLIRTIEKYDNSPAIYGNIIYKGPAHRDKSQKFYISYEEYPFASFPDFTNGQSYIIAGSAITSLFRVANRMKFFTFEDVFITGFVSTLAKVPRVHLKGMETVHKHFDPCTFKQILTSHGLSHSLMKSRYEEVSSKTFIC